MLNNNTRKAMEAIKKTPKQMGKVVKNLQKSGFRNEDILMAAFVAAGMTPVNVS